MRRSIKQICIGCAVALLWLTLLSFSAFAVPAKPGSMHTGENAACRSHAAGELVTLDRLAKRKGGAKTAKAAAAGQKNIPLVVIVIGFQDLSYQTGYDWKQEIFTSDRSLHAYYNDMSFGKFTFDPVQETSAYGTGNNSNKPDRANDGVVHVTLTTNHDDWTLDYRTFSQEKAYTKTMFQAFADALNQAKSYVNFASYDANRDKQITNDELAVAFVVAGYEASVSSRYSKGRNTYLWAHSWSMQEVIEAYSLGVTLPKPGGVTVSSYIAMAERLDTGEQEPISVLAHELGHYIGLPDLYDTEYLTRAEWREYDMDCLSVMCSGTWGEDGMGGYTPYSMDPWCRLKLGWYTPVSAAKSGNYQVVSQNYQTLKPYTVVKIPTQQSGEYYLLENRRPNKWDAGLMEEYEPMTPNGGIVLWHIDEGVCESFEEQNTINNTNHRPGVMPLFPESSFGRMTFIGEADTVFNRSPFFTAPLWEEMFSSLGPALDLPLYGTGRLANSRAARTLSGIKVKFLTDSAATMNVQVDRGDTQSDTPSQSDLCPYCNQQHSGSFGQVIAFFHRILYWVRNLFTSN